jgi:putative ABC transport system permease protein
VIIAATIAIPLAWFVLSLWLNEFYYRVSIQWHLFFLSVIAVGGFVSLILLMKTLRILRENPANVLKYE